jgi:hypothetical protein
MGGAEGVVDKDFVADNQLSGVRQVACFLAGIEAQVLVHFHSLGVETGIYQ